MDALAEIVTRSGPARVPTALAPYRGFEQGAETNSEARLSLAGLWRALGRGELRVVHSDYTDELCLTRLQRVQRPTPLKPTRIATLQRVLLGESPKAIAIERGVTLSAVISMCGDCLAATGSGRWTSRAPIWLSLAAQAGAGRRLPSPQVRNVPGGTPGLVELAFVRPDRALEGRLTRAEYGVVRAYLEGESHTNIANRCQSAPRTVANHLAAVFRKLGVSGRAPLLSRLIREQWPM